MRHDTAVIGTLCVAACMAGRTLEAQSIQLRYAPAAGALVHTMWWTESSITIREAARLGDSIALEASGLHSLTHRVLTVDGATRHVEVTLDSVRARLRPVGAPWQHVDAPGVGTTVNLAVDDRYRVLAVRAVRPDSAPAPVVESLRGFGVGFELAFPEQPVGPGTQWAADVVFFLDESPGLGDEPAVGGRLEDVSDVVARATFTLDSVTVREADTLAFVAASGAFLPTTLTAAPEDGAGTTTVRGAFSGAFIWSTAWQAFVSGAVRSRSTFTLEGRAVSEAGEAEPDPTAIVIAVDATSRFQVRR